MADIFDILAKSEKPPKNFIGLYDNLSLLLAYIKSTFETIALAAEGQVDEISHVADLGVILTTEASARANVLYEHVKTRLDVGKEC